MTLGKLDSNGIFAPPTGPVGNNSLGIDNSQLGAGSNLFGYRNKPLGIGSDSIGLGFVPIDFSNINNMKFNFMPPMNTSFVWTPTPGVPTFGTNTSNFINTPLTFDRQPIQYNTPVFTSNISLGSVDTFERSATTQTRQTTSTHKTHKTSSKTTKATASETINNKKIVNLDWWKAQGYNEEKGKALAINTKKRSNSLRAQGISGQCSRGVREGINDTFYSGKPHYSSFGQARLAGEKYLSKDQNFKKIDVSGIKLTKNNIPAGVTLIYGPGYSNSKINYCGHLEVSDGNGHGYSDVTTTLLQNWGRHREPIEVWIPV